jgi:hypothetical protein
MTFSSITVSFLGPRRVGWFCANLISPADEGNRFQAAASFFWPVPHEVLKPCLRKRMAGPATPSFYSGQIYSPGLRSFLTKDRRRIKMASSGGTLCLCLELTKPQQPATKHP